MQNSNKVKSNQNVNPSNPKEQSRNKREDLNMVDSENFYNISQNETINAKNTTRKNSRTLHSRKPTVENSDSSKSFNQRKEKKKNFPSKETDQLPIAHR